MIVPASVEGLEKGLVETLRNPDALRTKGQKLKAHVSKHFLWDSIIDKYIELYKGLAWNKPDPPT